MTKKLSKNIHKTQKDEMICSKCKEKMEWQHTNVYKCYHCGTFGTKF